MFARSRVEHDEYGGERLATSIERSEAEVDALVDELSSEQSSMSRMSASGS